MKSFKMKQNLNSNKVLEKIQIYFALLNFFADFQRKMLAFKINNLASLIFGYAMSCMMSTSFMLS